MKLRFGNGKHDFAERFAGPIAVLLLVLICIIALAISWGITVGIIYLICHCFVWSFSIKVASGIWLIILLLGDIFRGGSSS